MDSPDDEQQKRNVILAIDVGSSSIRCTAYDCCGNRSTDGKHTLVDPSFAILASYSYPRKSVETYTGHIRIVDDTSSISSSSVSQSTSDSRSAPTNHDLFDCIDTCVDQVLYQLQRNPNDSTCQMHDFNIVGVGFTTFVMNLIGIDPNGRPLGNNVTMSYACQTKQVQEEVLQIKR
jgi:sugar (pentulose or hexulose) kinase